MSRISGTMLNRSTGPEALVRRKRRGTKEPKEEYLKKTLESNVPGKNVWRLGQRLLY